MTGIRWNQNKIDIDNNFSYHVACEITEENEDLEPKSMEECKNRKYWNNRKMQQIKSLIILLNEKFSNV